MTVLRAAIGEAGARLGRPVLVVVSADDTVTQKSLRNIELVRVLASGQLNTYDVLASDHVVFTQAALAEFVARSGGELVTVDKPAKTAKAAKAAAGPGEDTGEPAAKPARPAKAKAAADGDAEEPAAKPARPAKAKAAADGDPEEPAAKPAKATASRARKPATASATEPAEDAEAGQAPPAVKRRSSGTSRKAASSDSDAEQKEEQE
jgi:large subunit ribosomal protein L4